MSYAIYFMLFHAPPRAIAAFQRQYRPPAADAAAVMPRCIIFEARRFLLMLTRCDAYFRCHA